MAHNINIVKGRASFFSRKEVPWHGLGQIVEYATNSEEAIKLAGLDYDVAKVPVFADFRELPYTFDNRESDIVPNYFATVRTDTRDILGLVGNRYEVVQNSKAFQFIDDIVGSKQAIFETAGALGKGERIFVTAKLPSVIRVKDSDDIIEKYIIFIASHDGSSPVIAGFTPIRVVCNNTLNMAMKNLSNKITLRHTRNVHEKLELGRELLGLYKIYSEEFQQVVNHLANIKINDDVVADSINQLILTSEELNIVANFGLYDERISTRKQNVINDLSNAVEAGIGQESNKGTALWLWNGVSSYYSNNKSYKSQEDRFNNVLDGMAYKNTQRMFNIVTAMG